MPARPWHRQAAFWLVLLLLALAVTEGGAAAVCWLVFWPRARELVWVPAPEQARINWNASGGAADEEIGWPLPGVRTRPPFDATGAKYNAEFPEPRDACVSAYGDSFVFGAEVPAQDGWIERLAHLLRCRIANYGVNSFGTDQSLVRLRRNQNDEAPVVLLGIFPEDVMRNVNQYRALMGYDPQPASLKGRFLLDDTGALSWVARPHVDMEEFVRLNQAPAEFLPHEYLLPGTRDGPITLRFPYTLALIRLLTAPRVWTRLTGHPLWNRFFDPDHASGALPLTVALVEAFVREAAIRGKRTLVVMLPGAQSFALRPPQGPMEYAPLAEALTAKSIDVFDAAPALTAALGGRSYCVLFSQPAECHGHYGVMGSNTLAEIVAAELTRRGLTKR
jgi:hypothetical protein